MAMVEITMQRRLDTLNQGYTWNHVVQEQPENVRSNRSQNYIAVKSKAKQSEAANETQVEFHATLKVQVNKKKKEH